MEKSDQRKITLTKLAYYANKYKYQAIIILLAIVFVGVIVGSLFYIQLSVQSTEKERLNTEVKNINTLQARALESLFSARIESLNNLSNCMSGTIVDIFVDEERTAYSHMDEQTYTASNVELTPLAKQTVIEYMNSAAVSRVVIINADGYYYVDYIEGLAPFMSDLSQRSWFNDIDVDDTVVTDMYYDPIGQDYVFALVVPIVRDDSIIAYILSVIDTDTVASHVNNLSMVDGASAVILNQDNGVVVGISESINEEIISKHEVMENDHEQVGYTIRVGKTSYYVFSSTVSYENFREGVNWCVVSVIAENMISKYANEYSFSLTKVELLIIFMLLAVTALIAIVVYRMRKAQDVQADKFAAAMEMFERFTFEYEL